MPDHVTHRCAAPRARLYARLPPRARWDFWRWVALAIGASALVYGALFWHAAARDWRLIPWDAAFTEDGDMTLLQRDHRWDEARITGRYVAVARACAGALAALWAAHAVAAWRRVKTEATRGGT